MRPIKIAALLCLIFFGCSAKEPQPTQVTSALSTTPNVLSIQDTAEHAPEITVSEPVPVDYKAIANQIGPQIASAGIANLIWQETITQPSEAHILYLMRAARYREAADYASRGPQKDNIRFVQTKARILAGLCSDSAPCFEAFNTLKTNDSDLKPIFHFWQARALTEDLQFEKALNAIAAYLTTYNNIPKTRDLILAFDKTAQKTGFYTKTDKSSVLTQFKSLISKVTNSANQFEAASLIHIQMVIEQALGNEKTADGKKTQLVLHYPATQMSLWPELAGSCEDMANRYSPNERMSRISRLISHFDYDNARKELKSIVDDTAMSSKIRDTAEWELAKVSMTNSEDPGLSEKIYRKWAKKGGANKEEAVFGISRALSRQLRYRDAIKALQNYDKLYPKGKYASRSLYLRGWYLFDLREDKQARPLLLAYAEKTNDTSVWGFYAQSFLREGMWSEAIEAFEHLKNNKNPIVRGKALYWQAVADHHLGKDESAQKRLTAIHSEFPLTWYDMLSYQREEDWFGRNADEAYRELFRWKSDPTTDVVFHAWGYGTKLKKEPASSIWTRVKTLSSYDAIEEARSLYTSNESSLLKVLSGDEQGEFRRYATHLVESYYEAWSSSSGSIRALSQIMPSRANIRHKMAYPQPFAPLVESLAKEYGLPHYFIYGIMLQESRFRPWQVSSADAIGALQMIPRTARPIAKALGVEFHPDTFFDPRVGFPYSAYYMKMHYERWGHNLAFTAGSYNGGPHRIGPWALRDKGKTLDVIVDEFSFDESRHYARKVSEHTLRFAYLYAHNENEWLSIVHQLFPRVVPEIEAVDDWGL